MERRRLYYTAAEARRILGVSRRRLHQLLAQGRLTGHYDERTGSWRIERESVHSLRPTPMDSSITPWYRRRSIFLAVPLLVVALLVLGYVGLGIIVPSLGGCPSEEQSVIEAFPHYSGEQQESPYFEEDYCIVRYATDASRNELLTYYDEQLRENGFEYYPQREERFWTGVPETNDIAISERPSDLPQGRGGLFTACRDGYSYSIAYYPPPEPGEKGKFEGRGGFSRDEPVVNVEVAEGWPCTTGSPGGETSELGRVTIEASGGQEVEVQVEIADDAAEQERGLMERTELGENSGMLFVYQEEQQRSFWMRDTLIPLSIAYIDAEGQIVDIQDMQPLDETSHPSAEPAQYALEVNQGFFEDHGVQVGDTVELPPDAS
jgi:uncharacterized membrane protein (UPF0127 family)